MTINSQSGLTIGNRITECICPYGEKVGALSSRSRCRFIFQRVCRIFFSLLAGFFHITRINPHGKVTPLANSWVLASVLMMSTALVATEKALRHKCRTHGLCGIVLFLPCGYLFSRDFFSSGPRGPVITTGPNKKRLENNIP